jgi:type II secretory pathway pseudopilin PulG
MRKVTMSNKKSRPRRKGESGYILVTLMLFVALMAMALVAVLPELTFQMKRDREEEMVHRGVQ